MASTACLGRERVRRTRRFLFGPERILRFVLLPRRNTRSYKQPPEHENAIVRSSCAQSLTEGAERWTGQVAKIIQILQTDFLEKVRPSLLFSAPFLVLYRLK